MLSRSVNLKHNAAKSTYEVNMNICSRCILRDNVSDVRLVLVLANTHSISLSHTHTHTHTRTHPLTSVSFSPTLEKYLELQLSADWLRKYIHERLSRVNSSLSQLSLLLLLLSIAAQLTPVGQRQALLPSLTSLPLTP